MTISTVISSTTEVAAAEGYCSRPMSLEIRRPTLADWLPDMNRTVMKSPITSVSDEDRADHDAGLGQRDDDVPQDLRAGGAGVARRLDQRFVDAHHGVEDRARP